MPPPMSTRCGLRCVVTADHGRPSLADAVATFGDRVIRAYRWVSGTVIAAVVVLCVAARHLGISRTGFDTGYFYEVFDVGHPGIVNAITSMGLLCVSVLSLVLGFLTARGAWFVNCGLFVVLAADNILRLHNQIPAGDVVARLAYWAVLVWLVLRLEPLRHGVHGRAMLLLGLGSLAASELLDVIGNDGEGTAAVLEESLGCIGSWALAMAMVGVAISSLVAVGSATSRAPG